MAKKSKELKLDMDAINNQHIIDVDLNSEMKKAYIDYAMSVIVSRALPDVRDGMKPVHRRILYDMYEANLLYENDFKKSAATVGDVLAKYHPHGDASVYDAMVRLAQDFSLRYPLVQGKGNFGSVDGDPPAAYRYTEAKMSKISALMLTDIEKNTVDYVPNYDDKLKEPDVLPSRFPNLLVNGSAGIAVGMATNIPPHNLTEVVDGIIAVIDDPMITTEELMTHIQGPDFPTGGEILYDASEMLQIYNTGRGTFRLRARWRYLKEGNMIEIYEIPYTTATEIIMDKVAELIKAGKVREIADMRDETDLNGLKLTIDLKRGADPDKLMQKLFKTTTLQDAFGCNFNILIAGMPRVMGVREIFSEWTAWRTECVRRRLYFQMNKKKDKLHLLKGLGKILLDIDKAIRIIRETELDAEVIPNLMIGFGIDQVQAEYVAEIKLRNINKEFILNRLKETESLEKEIADLEATLGSEKKVQALICKELEQVAQKYGKARKTTLVYDHELQQEPDDEPENDYPVTVFLSREGYFKKITAQSLRMSGEQKFKEGDGLLLTRPAQNSEEMLVFTDKYQVYKTKISDFADGKASALGDFLPGKLGFDEGESFLTVIFPGKYEGNLLFVFENGKAAKVTMSGYDTKSNRKRLTGAYSDKSPIKAVIDLPEEKQIAVRATDGRVLVFSTAQLSAKTTRATQGVAVMSLKRKAVVESAMELEKTAITNVGRYSARTLPAAGALLREEDTGETQMKLDI